MSGTTMSTPRRSSSGNMSPASITIRSAPKRRAMQFMPNSPRPPRGIICSLFAAMDLQFTAYAARSHVVGKRFALAGRCSGLGRAGAVGGDFAVNGAEDADAEEAKAGISGIMRVFNQA